MLRDWDSPLTAEGVEEKLSAAAGVVELAMGDAKHPFSAAFVMSAASAFSSPPPPPSAATAQTTDQAKLQ